MVNLKNSYFTHTELKQALKDFKAQRDDVQHPVVLYGFDLLFTYYFCALIACFLYYNTLLKGYYLSHCFQHSSKNVTKFKVDGIKYLNAATLLVQLFDP